MRDDKLAEFQRYDARAKAILAEKNVENIALSWSFGSSEIPLTLRAPYLYYEQCIHKYISKEHSVLEIGSGLHTYALVQTGAYVVASDISKHSLLVLRHRIKTGRLETVTGDMESLPFGNESFDVICSAGSLSYGDPDLVNQEILRLLRPGGIFICVDSLNHNPIYRLNRWLHYVKGDRSKSPPAERVALS